MSTVISNGYRLPKGLTLKQLFGWVKDIRPPLEHTAKIAMHQAFYRLAVDYLDQEILIAAGHITPNEALAEKIDSRTSSLLSRARYEADDMRRERKKEGQRDHAFDTESTLIVIPEGQRLYALLFASHQKIQKQFEAIEGVEEYNYWNNSDEPDEISRSAWKTRGKRWDRMLGTSGIPADAGASFQLVKEATGFYERVKEEHLVGMEKPTLERRVQEITHQTTAVVETYPPIVAGANFYPFMAHRRSLEKGECPIFNTMKEKVSAVLPADIPFEWLVAQKAERKALIEQWLMQIQSPSVSSTLSRPRI